MDFLNFEFLVSTARNGDPEGASSSQFVIADDNAAITFYGTGFGGLSQGYPTVGTISYFSFNSENANLTLSGLAMPVATFRDFVARNDASGLRDYIMGGADVLRGAGAGAVGDVIYGFGGNDTIEGYGGGDRLDGGVGDDILYGNVGDDTLVGNEGFDVLVGGSGNDLIDGGSGLSDYAAFPDLGQPYEPTIGRGVTVSLMLQGAPQDTGHGRDTLINIESLQGSVYADTLTGDNQANVVIGDGGNDSLSGMGGNDNIFINAGNSTVDGGAGIDLLNFSRLATSTTFSLALQGGVQATGRGNVLATNVENITGSSGNDLFAGDSGNNVIQAGAGNDTISDVAGANYLRGDEGDDVINGGAGFDDANGNMGNDTIHGNDGDDFSVGGKENDLLFGDGGADVVWGNLGNDTCDGGDGADQVRGGQGDDIVRGGAGDDFVSGDRGNDTITGGSGADLFHGSQDAGIDRVLDFNLSEGDRVFLDPGTTYTVGQQAADTVIDMGAGHQMVLVGVQLSSLTAGWIFGA